MPYLTFADIPLLHDLNREASDFVERYQSLSDTVLSGVFPHSQSWQTNPNSKTTNIGLPLVNWPKPPPLKINQLYYPVTGASRWAEGVFLCGGELKAYIDNCNIAATGASLRWATDDPPTMNNLLGTGKRYISLNWMWPIAFRRISGCATDVMHDPNGVLPIIGTIDQYDLYLVHFVDRRYWWQFVDADIICEHTKTWITATPPPAGEPTGLINYLCDRLGLVMLWADADIASWPAIYTTLGPHQSEWSRTHHNAAQLLDAALESVGARLVAQTDAAVVPYGGFEIQRAAGAETRFQSNISTGHWTEQIAGTYCSQSYAHVLPAAVEVLFPSSRFGMLCGQCDVANTDLTEEDCHESYWPIVHLKTEYSGVSNSCTCTGTAKTIFVRGWADMGKCGDTAPMNNTELVALASQIAYDWFMYRKRQYDFTVVGPTAWDPCGYDDCIIHKFGVEEDEDLKAFAHSETKQTGEVDTTVILQQERRRDCTSRIQSLPLNVGADCQLHNTNALELSGHLMVKTPSGGIAAPDGDTLTGELCVAYRVVGDLSCGEIEREKVTAINAANLGEDYQVMVYNTVCDQDIEGDQFIETAPYECCARKAIRICYDYSLTGGALAENHPGRGVPFDIHLGTWDPASDGWSYDCNTTVKAIDWRYGVPYPDEDATGLFQKRTSTNYGSIYEVVALDCESANDACNGSSS